MSCVLAIENLSLQLGGRRVLEDVSLTLQSGEVTALIGRSGSGKSMTALAIMGLAPGDAHISGAIKLDDVDLLKMDQKSLCAVRGAKVGMVFQEPMTALNPLHTIAAQVAEVFLTHENTSREDAYNKARNTLTRVGLDPNIIPHDRFPHQLSGGQRQRAVIAMAIAMKPKVLIADEPTTALDVTTQAHILDLLRHLAKVEGMALLLITHDLAVVSNIADNIAVIKDGSIIDYGHADRFYSREADSRSREYLPARVVRNKRKLCEETVLSTQNIICEYAQRPHSLLSRPTKFRAVENVSFELKKGENLGLVGESGCGKSTLAQALLGLVPLADGGIALAKEKFPTKDAAAMRRLRRKIQIVFQDPYSSFNPRQHIIDIIAEPFHLHDQKLSAYEKRSRVCALLQSVGLSENDADKYPHQFSGGQRQRIATARALATEPDIIVLDEATSALDVVSRNRILALLEKLSEERGVSLLLITHDLSVIRDIADRVMIMRAGRIIETGQTRAIFEAPREPYTKALIEAAPAIKWRDTGSGEEYV
ncbi:ABC transporter ATP-binding protein [Hyphococcus flavus]|uniref:ABC transporter ATP-binding protein n=1 Tax=Hyphococcus flavus TaxID=1866326 RepID=A0AAE9ZCY5_9PROT|nr:ABC transporter ATP-binding protein [Hyphococcus flavus]WDI31235.1 ABC transporter ATP-binding protein [Hyphococcus flavus]